MRRLTAMVMVATALAGCGYNRMVALKESVDSAWAQVENQLQRRNDLIPNLVSTVRGYAAHEQTVFERIADARARLLAGGSRDEKINAANEMTSALGRLLAIAERYPDLKANQQFNRLSDELAGTENRIAVERKRFNDAVREYNTYIKALPQMVYAAPLGFETQRYFEAPGEAKQVPKVDFATPSTTAPPS